MAPEVLTDAPVGIEQLTPAEKTTWHLTGEMPKPIEAESAPAKDSETISETPQESKSAPASEPAAPKDAQHESDGQFGPKAQKRIKQLLSKVKELESKLVTPPSRETVTEKKADTAHAAKREEAPKSAEPKANDANADGSPKYKTYEEFMDAKIEYGVEKRLEAREAKQTEVQRDAQIGEINKAIEDSWKARVESAKTTHTDFVQKALNPDLPIRSGSQVDSFILDSELGAEVLYYLANHRDELDVMNSRKPHEGWKTVRELVKIENSLSGSAAPRPAESKTSKAPPPVREVGGRGTIPADEEGSAVGNADFRSYAAAANRRETASLRKG
jgi:hypothetical protein